MEDKERSFGCGVSMPQTSHSRWGRALWLVPLLAMLLVPLGTKAADSPGVKFNSGVRYSQWAINSRANDFYANTTHCGMPTITNGSVTKEDYGKTSLDYVPGLVAKSMIEAADYYEGFDWSKPWFLSVKKYGDKYCNVVANKGGSLDDLNAVKLYFGLYNNANASTADKTNYKTAISRAQTGLVAHNTNYSIKSGTLAGDDVVGGWFHKADYNNQMWLDGAYMGSALLAQIVNFNGTSSNIFGSTTADWDMVFKQMNIVWHMCWDSTDKLMYHAFEANAGTGTSSSNANTWAGLSGTAPYVFHSQSYWGRANAWYLMALVDVLEAMDKAGQSGTDNYKTLKQHLADLAAGIAARQDATTGGWYQILDKDDSFTATSYNSKWSGMPSSATNYIETSATAIFSAAYFKAVRLGLLANTANYDYKLIAEKAFEGLVNNYTYLDENGNLEIFGSCRSAGLGGKGDAYKAGGNKFRDGSNAYYLLGFDVPMVAKDEKDNGNYVTEGKVLGGFIMAATEYERAYQNQDTKQILFARDLAPAYTISSSDVLDATAYGANEATYQWYKDGAAVADATSATYSPTESGKYYCVATAGGTSITTSTTDVTVKSSTGGDANQPADEGEVVFSGDDLKSYQSPMTDATNVVTITTTTGTVSKESDGDIKVAKNAAFSISVPEGKYIKSITYTIKSIDKGTLTFDPEGSKNSSVDLTYTYNYSDTSLKSVTATNSADKGGIQVTSIKVVYGTISTTKKNYTVTTSAHPTEGGNVTVTSDAADVTSTTSFDEGTQLKFTATANEGYTFSGWTVNNTAVEGTDATYTISSLAANTTVVANFTKNETPVDPTESTMVYDFINKVGSAAAGSGITIGDDNIKLGTNFKGNEGKYLTVTAKDNGGFKAGDVVTVKGYCAKKNSGVVLYSDVKASEPDFQSPAFGAEEVTYTFTVQADCDNLYIGRFGGSTTYITSLTVERSASSSDKTRLTAAFAKNSDVVLNTTKELTLPQLTVKAGSDELGSDGYDVEYTSNDESIATVANGKIAIHADGTVTILATVTPHDKDSYEGCTATYTITVKEPSPLNISTIDIEMNATDAEAEQPIIKVYGDDDKLLVKDVDYTLAFEVSDGSNVKVTDGVFSVTGSKYAWDKGVSTIKVTATPTAALNGLYAESSLTFTYSVTEGKITPKFLDAFNGTDIKLALNVSGLDSQYRTKTFTVPLVYDGEDVSDYFDYTFTVANTGASSSDVPTNSADGNVLTLTKNLAGKFTVTVSATPKTDDKDPDNNYADVYNAPSSISFTVTISSDCKVVVASLDPSEVDMYAGTRMDAPDLTVEYTDGTVVDDDKYTVTWTSFAPGIVKVNETTGQIEAASEGEGKVRATIRPTDDSDIESTTAFILVKVDDPAVYAVKNNKETYGNQRVMWNQNKTLAVTLGSWMFPEPGNPDGDFTDDALSDKAKWADGASSAKRKMTGFSYLVSGNGSKNARQENGSNSLSESTSTYNVDFTKKKTIVDQMFNVPCSGSYLVFNPVANGTVNVHIFQNGAFDYVKASGNKEAQYQYRPQRRVFVMDEAGNFVSSKAHIESTTAELAGGYDITKYSWDITSETPTKEMVEGHFDGLEDFVMTKEGFKNNVYENSVSRVILPNQAAENRKDLPAEEKVGVNGWSVLADSPVTYTFNVKAGKTYYLYNFGSKIGFYGFSFEEDVAKPVVDEVAYRDDQTNVIKSTENGHVATVSVNRSFKAGVWNTCVLPFSLNMHQVDAIFGPAYRKDYPNGTQILYFDHVEGSKACFVRHAYNTIVANKPFLIKPANDVAEINTADIADYPYVTIEAPVGGKPAAWCESNGYAWVSSYSNDMTVKKGDCFISNKDGSFKNWVGDDATLKGFRGYLKNVGNGGVAEAKTLTVAIGSNVTPDETSAVEGIFMDSDSAAAGSVADGKVYNLNGQVVATSQRQFQTLPAGVYMVNGKKVIK